MYVCYIDEAGCPGALPSATSPVQPVLVLGGLFVEQARLHALTLDFLALKKRYFPAYLPPTDPYLHWVLPEVKGADLRRQFRGSRNEKRHATGFLDRVFELLTRHDARLTGRIWIKAPGAPFDGRAVYTSSVQAIASCFQNYLDHKQARGMVVLDSRTPYLNTQVSFSIFTEKFRQAGDKYPGILEMPTFGHSESHVGIQIMDAICSAVLFPVAALTYCHGHVQNVHVDQRYADARTRFGPRLNALQHRYQEASGRWRGGLVVNDPISQRSAREILR